MNEKQKDNTSVDAFALAMKEKLAAMRAKHRGGWHDKSDCSQQHLSDLLRQAVNKGDPIDVANYAMMLHQRGEVVLPTFYPSADEDVFFDMGEHSADAWQEEQAFPKPKEPTDG